MILPGVNAFVLKPLSARKFPIGKDLNLKSLIRILIHERHNYG
jgi:hypothetical protein